jgi:DNA-binding NtrC family response regulator
MQDKRLKPTAPARSRQRAARPRRGRAPQTTILVVDDEEAVRETIVEALGIQGYRVVAAASVEEAEATLHQLGAEGLQLVITDVHLTPGPQARAGYALAQRWRTMHPRLPVMLMSGDPSNQDLPEVRAGEMQFLLKPFHIKILLETVRDALGR